MIYKSDSEALEVSAAARVHELALRAGGVLVGVEADGEREHGLVSVQRKVPLPAVELVLHHEG